MYVACTVINGDTGYGSGYGVDMENDKAAACKRDVRETETIEGRSIISSKMPKRLHMGWKPVTGNNVTEYIEQDQ